MFLNDEKSQMTGLRISFFNWLNGTFCKGLNAICLQLYIVHFVISGEGTV